MGSIAALIEVVARLPANLPAAVLVAQHVPRDRRSVLPSLLLRLVWIDWCCALNEMADVLNSVAHMPRAPSGSDRSLRCCRSKTGSRRACWTQTWHRLEALSTPLAHTCHICGAPTRQLIDTRIERYRCRVGHASLVDVSETMGPTVFDGAAHLHAP